MKTSHTGVLPLVLSVLAADASPLGLTFVQVREATGLGQRQASSALHNLLKQGKCCATGKHREDRFYYANAGRMADCRQAVDARMVEVRAQRLAARKARERAADLRWRARRGLPEPKPRVAATKLAKKGRKAAPAAVPATVTVRKTPAQRWTDAQPVIPPTVKVTKCPGYVPRTFAPPPFFRGPFTTEWQQLREQTDSRPRSKAAGRSVHEVVG